MTDLRISFDNLPQMVGLLFEEVKKLNTFIKESARFTEPIASNEDVFLDVEETAKFLRLSISTIYTKKSKGELPSMKIGNRLYFSKQELTNYLKSGKELSYQEIEEQASLYLSNQKEIK